METNRPQNRLHLFITYHDKYIYKAKQHKAHRRQILTHKQRNPKENVPRSIKSNESAVIYLTNYHGKIIKVHRIIYLGKSINIKSFKCTII